MKKKAKQILDEFDYQLIHKHVRISPPKTQLEKLFKNKKKYDRSKIKQETEELMDDLE